MSNTHPPVVGLPQALSIAAALAWGLLLLFSVDPLGALPVLCAGQLIATLPSHAELAFVLGWVSPTHLAMSWTVMLFAMMLPAVAGPVAHVRARSFAHERAMGGLGFLAGYLGIWLAAGAPLIGLAIALRLTADISWLPFVVTLGLALAWQMTTWKQVALNRCHMRYPRAAFGSTAMQAWLGFGWRHGLWCVVSCAPIMLSALLAPVPSYVSMPIAALWIWAERLEAPREPETGFIIPMRAFRALNHRVTHTLNLRSGRASL
ncbi:MAG: DUF2182 domain-containing protein [Pseudomonadota bacterium]